MDQIPFTLKNAAQMFQHLSESVAETFLLVLFTLSISPSPEEPKIHFWLLFKHLQKYDPRTNLSKCIFNKEEIEFIGHHFIAHDITPTQEKAHIIANFPKPVTIADLKKIREFYHVHVL